jgi:hypothetical protein
MSLFANGPTIKLGPDPLAMLKSDVPAILYVGFNLAVPLESQTDTSRIGLSGKRLASCVREMPISARWRWCCSNLKCCGATDHLAMSAEASA